MTIRLYHDDPDLRSFEARITARTTVNGKPAVALDRTAFYPTGGGQPFDTGTLGGAPVSEVIDREDGTIVHVARNKFGCYIGDDVTIGHLALIHACTLEPGCFIGMQATVMDGCVVESGGYPVQPACDAPPFAKKLRRSTAPPRKNIQ